MAIVPKDPFKVEELRDKMAFRNRIKVFKKTYSKNYPQIIDLNTSKLWDSLNNRKHMDSSISPMITEKLSIISRLIPNEKISVLNIGCGGGDLENVVFKKIKNNELDWTGVDISPKSIKSCKEEFPNAKFLIGDIRKLNTKIKYDIIVLMEIMEHIKPSETFMALNQVNRILKSGGKLIVSIPINEGLSEMIKRGENPNAHVRAYTENIIRTELKTCGFKVKEVISLFAFSKLYWIKSFISKYLLSGIRTPNNLIIFAEKL